jgi:hypothetical protein
LAVEPNRLWEPTDKEVSGTVLSKDAGGIVFDPIAADEAN